MIKKCMGCGAELQYDKPEMAGYTESDVFEKADLCRRCFRLRCYGDYVFINKDNEEYIQILKDISKTKDLVLYLADMFNLNNSIKDINKYLDNPIILVLSKRDIIPKSVKTKKFIKWLSDLDLQVVDIIDVSSEKNYHFDQLYQKIQKHRKSENVYVVGNTNAGKSTLVNAMIKNYSNNKSSITTSMLPSTTLELMEIKLNDDITLIDTPGLIDEGNIANVLDYTVLKKVNPKKEIKPRTYQMKGKQSLLVEKIARLDYLNNHKNSFTFYISNEVEIDHANINTNVKLKDLPKVTLELNGQEDVVINGLCWIKVTKEAKIDIYISDEIEVFKRKNIV